jgi:hypothetical protein
MRRLLLMAVGFTVVATAPIMFGQDASLERGKYLVEAYTLKAEEADAIAAYLKSLP